MSQCNNHISRDHFVYAPSQWETTLHCNIFSHWLGAYTKWSLYKAHSRHDHSSLPWYIPQYYTNSRMVKITYCVIVTGMSKFQREMLNNHWFKRHRINMFYIATNMLSPKVLVNSLRLIVAYIVSTNVVSDNGLWPGRRQAIIWTNVKILSIGTNFSEITPILSQLQCVKGIIWHIEAETKLLPFHLIFHWSLFLRFHGIPAKIKFMTETRRNGCPPTHKSGNPGHWILCSIHIGQVSNIDHSRNPENTPLKWQKTMAWCKTAVSPVH